MSDAGDDSPKKDLTQITDLPLLPETKQASSEPEVSPEFSPTSSDDAFSQSPESPSAAPALDGLDLGALDLPTAGAEVPLATHLDFAELTSTGGEGTPDSAFHSLPSSDIQEAPPAVPAPPALQDLEPQLTSRPYVAASNPFTLRIAGELRPEEREKLLEILSRENLGIREMDLEHQFASHQILIPRVSEYVGVLIIQQLRQATVEFALAPSDGFPEMPAPAFAARVETQTPAAPLVFEDIPVTQDAELQGLGTPIPIDVVSASASIQAALVEARQSQAFEEVVDNLKRELKARAHYRGAKAITHFEMQLLPLKDPALYRITLSGSAVRWVEAHGPRAEAAARPARILASSAGASEADSDSLSLQTPSDPSGFFSQE